MWEASTPFEDAVGPLGENSDIRILALRTCKGDTVAGLPEGKDEELRASQGKEVSMRAWAWKGEWALCQFHDGKKK